MRPHGSKNKAKPKDLRKMPGWMQSIKSQTVRQMLADRLGLNGEVAFDVVINIALGNELHKVVTREGDVVELGPSIKDRLEAAKFLIPYIVGKPTENVNISMQTADNSKNFDISKLSESVLVNLHEAHEAARKALEANTNSHTDAIETTFTHTAAPPSDTNVVVTPVLPKEDVTETHTSPEEDTDASE